MPLVIPRTISYILRSKVRFWIAVSLKTLIFVIIFRERIDRHIESLLKGTRGSGRHPMDPRVCEGVKEALAEKGSRLREGNLCASE